MNIKIIYWPKGGSVEKVAQQLEGKLKGVKAYSVEELDFNMLADTDLMILGGSTVGAEDWKNTNYTDAWSMFFGELKAKGISMANKKAALYGLGNQILYPSHFVDSLKHMADSITESGATLVGACKNKGYHFEASEALVDGKFVGLPLDEDTEAQLTDARLEAWIADLGL